MSDWICPWTGVTEMLKCPKGFPGCYCMDDAIALDDKLGEIENEIRDIIE